MKNLVLMSAAALLAISGPTASAAQQKRSVATVEVRVLDAAGGKASLSDISIIHRQQITSLRQRMQQWGNQQPENLTITIECRFNPLNCTITISAM